MDTENKTTENEETTDQKELLRKRVELQMERQKSQYMTDAEEKEQAFIRMEQEKQLEKELAPFVSIRKFCIWACGFMWLFAVFCLLSGTLEARLFLPLCLLVLCATAGINVPIFFKKKNYRDAVISCIAAIVCAAAGLVIFVLA